MSQKFSLYIHSLAANYPRLACMIKQDNLLKVKIKCLAKNYGVMLYNFYCNHLCTFQFCYNIRIRIYICNYVRSYIVLLQLYMAYLQSIDLFLSAFSFCLQKFYPFLHKCIDNYEDSHIVLFAIPMCAHNRDWSDCLKII